MSTGSVRFSRDTDTLMSKAIACLKRDKTKIVKITDEVIIAKVEGQYSNDPSDRSGIYHEKEPYLVKIHKNGSHSCSCEALIYAKRKRGEYAQYHQFWGQDPNRDQIKLIPECSHVLAIKLTYTYKKWIIRDQIMEKWKKRAREDPSITDWEEKAEKEIEDIAMREPEVLSVVREKASEVTPENPPDLDGILYTRKRRKIDLLDDL